MFFTRSMCDDKNIAIKDLERLQSKKSNQKIYKKVNVMRCQSVSVIAISVRFCPLKLRSICFCHINCVPRDFLKTLVTLLLAKATLEIFYSSLLTLKLFSFSRVIFFFSCWMVYWCRVILSCGYPSPFIF